MTKAERIEDITEDTTEIRLGGKRISHEGAKAVAKALEGCKNLTYLNLSQNNIGDEGAKAVAKALEGCKNLQTLDLSQNNIGDEGAKAVAKALEGCKNLTHLNLSHNNIGEEGAKAVAKALEGCKNLQTLDLQYNNIREEGAKAVAKALEGCKNLQTLDLQDNNIGDEGAKAVAKALEGCKNLETLDLGGNNIGDDGAKAVAKSLHKACPSVEIDFYALIPLTPKELFERVCSPGEDITDSSLDADSVETAESEPSAEPKNKQDGVHRAEVATLDGSGERPDGASVSFADVVQLAKNVSNLRADRGGVRGNSLQTGIALLEEFIRPAIQGYFGQVKLRQVSADIKNSKQCLDALQGQIRASSANELPSLIEKRNAERDRLRLLMQVVYPWARANLCESDEDVVRDFKMRIESLVHDLKITLAPVTENTSTDDFKHCQELAVQAGRCVEEYKRNGEPRANNIGERSQQAAKCVVSRLSELELGDGLWVALRVPEQAMDLGPELSELERALQEEIEALQGDTLSAHLSQILCAISSMLARFELYSENTVLNDASKCTPQEFSELYDYALLGLKEPSVLDVEELYQKLDKSKKATESLKRAREDLEAEDLEEDEREHYRSRIKKQKRILSKGNPIELSKVFRHKLAETLQHAQEHYPELLQDRAWLERLHVTAEGVFEVACFDLWLTNVTVSDFQRVGEPLSFRCGKKVQKVLDNVGKKVMVLKEFQLGHPSQSKTFYKQVANLGKVVSQHVIRITGAFVDMTHGEPRGCIVMPFYERGDLAKWIESHPNEGKEARDRLAVGLLIGVADLHAHGIVHCDIKPENIFLTSNGTPLIGDFDGIKVANYTATYTSLQATPRYVAPELQSGSVDRFETAMDMYSVGISLKELYPTKRTAAMQTLIEALTATDPSQRPSAHQALQHEAFGAPQIPTKICLVCLEEHLLSEGTSCEEGDFLCRDCIETAVKSAAQPLAHVRVDADGAMACMKPECSGRISGQEITRLAPTALNHLLLIAKTKAENEAAVWAEKEIQRRIAEVLRAGEQNSAAEHHLLHIQEKILSTCCPNCNTYVHEFEGCCAVKCGNNACGHLFCAWCLGYSSQDEVVCHAHVRTCSRRLGQDLFFPDSFEQVREAWRLLRAERLREYWDANIQDINLRLVLKELLAPLITPDIVGEDFRLE